jgi:predicted site-specific integrase-resolvase
MSEIDLLTAREVDRLLRWSRGRAARYGRSGALPCIVLPDGELRFDCAALEAWLARQTTPPEGGQKQ